MGKKHKNFDKKKKVLNDYRDGKSVREIANKHKISTGHVAHWIQHSKMLQMNEQQLINDLEGIDIGKYC